MEKCKNEVHGQVYLKTFCHCHSFVEVTRNRHQSRLDQKFPGKRLPTPLLSLLLVTISDTQNKKTYILNPSYIRTLLLLLSKKKAKNKITIWENNVNWYSQFFIASLFTINIVFSLSVVVHTSFCICNLAIFSYRTFMYVQREV